jgi:hypothetical protein
MSDNQHSTRSRLGRVFGALITLGLIAVLLPALLVTMGRWRFGSALPWFGVHFDALRNPSELTALIASRITDQMLVDIAVRVVLGLGWICVVILLYSVLIEVIAQLRGGGVPGPRVRGLGWTQSVARSVAGGLLLIIPMNGLVQAGAIPTQPAFLSSVQSGLVHHTVDQHGSHQHEVRIGETLWEIADQVLGDPLRWTEIWSLNQDQTMNDGRVFEDPHLILPGWMLRIPAALVAPAAAITEPTTPTSTAHVPVSISLPPFKVSPHPELAGHDFGLLEEELLGQIHNGSAAIRSDAVNFPSPDHSSHADPLGGPEIENQVEQAESLDQVQEDPAETNNLLLHLGSATMLATGILAGLAARRRQRLRSSATDLRPLPIARLLMDRHLSEQVPPNEYDQISDEFADDVRGSEVVLADAGERILRLDLVLRIVAGPMVAGDQAVAAVFTDDRGEIEIWATGDVELERPFRGEGRRWVLPAQIGLDRLIELARGQEQPSPALIHLGNCPDGREVFVDLEVIGVLSVTDEFDHGESDQMGRLGTLTDVLRAIQVTLQNSLFGHNLELYWVGGSEAEMEITSALVGPEEVRFCSGFEELMEVSEVSSGCLRVVVVSGILSLVQAPEQLWSGDTVVIGRGEVPVSGAILRGHKGVWTLSGPVLESAEIPVMPIGVSASDVADLAALIEEESVKPVLVYRAPEADPMGYLLDATNGAAETDVSGAVAATPTWSLMVRMMGTVDVVDVAGNSAHFERSKSLELLAWCVTHRGRSTRSAARTALWEMNVRDATFANVVSEARRATAALQPPHSGRDWVHRTLTEELVLDGGITSDVEVMRATLDQADLMGVGAVVAEVEAAIALIRGMPYEASNYLWPEAEGISSDLILIATSLATSLAMHHLAQGDVPGVFRATAAGLLALPGHEELIALRMRAHGAAGDLAGVKQEWLAYQRVIARDPWSSGEPAPKLRDLSIELLGLEV